MGAIDGTAHGGGKGSSSAKRGQGRNWATVTHAGETIEGNPMNAIEGPFIATLIRE